jgi:hypothetical protein
VHLHRYICLEWSIFYECMRQEERCFNTSPASSPSDCTSLLSNSYIFSATSYHLHEIHEYTYMARNLFDGARSLLHVTLVFRITRASRPLHTLETKDISLLTRYLTSFTRARSLLHVTAMFSRIARASRSLYLTSLVRTGIHEFDNTVRTLRCEPEVFSIPLPYSLDLLVHIDRTIPPLAETKYLSLVYMVRDLFDVS